MRDSSRLALIPRPVAADETNSQIALLRWAKDQAARPGHSVIEIPEQFDHDEAMAALELELIAERRRQVPPPVVLLSGQGRNHADSLSQGIVCGIFVAAALLMLAGYLLAD